MIEPEYGIVLCAGLGVRLRPLTDVRPKPLVRFLDQPLATYPFRALVRAGVWTIGANGHYHALQLRPFLDEMSAEAAGQGVQIDTHLVVEDQLMGTGGGALGVWEAFGRPRKPVMVLNGDVVSAFPLAAMVKVHKRTGAKATMLMIPPVTGEAAVQLDASRRFVAQLPGVSDELYSPGYEATHLATFGGVSIVEPEILERLPDGNSCIIRSGIGPAMAEGELVAAYAFDGFWADVGTPSRFAQATWDVLRDPSLLPNGPLAPDENGVTIEEGARGSRGCAGRRPELHRGRCGGRRGRGGRSADGGRPGLRRAGRRDRQRVRADGRRDGRWAAVPAHRARRS